MHGYLFSYSGIIHGLFGSVVAGFVVMLNVQSMGTGISVSVNEDVVLFSLTYLY